MWPIFKTKMLVYQSNSNLVIKILFCKISHLSDTKRNKMLVTNIFQSLALKDERFYQTKFSYLSSPLTYR